jgi:hypothetical protein
MLSDKFKETMAIMSKYSEIKKNDNTLTDKEALIQAIRAIRNV